MLGHLIRTDASRRGAAEFAKRVAQLFLTKSSGVPLVVSLLAHVGIVVVAAHHVQLASSTSSALAEIDLSGSDLVHNDDALSALRLAPIVSAARPNVAPRSDARVAYRDLTATPRQSASEPATVASVTASTESDAPRFVMTVARTAPRSSELPSAKPSSSRAVAVGQAPLAESLVEVPARLRAGTPPAYTAAALAAGVEADVPLEIVVSEAGVVIGARGLAHVGYGLDEAALESVRGFRFSAASHDGKAVAVRMKWLMRFQLQ